MENHDHDPSRDDSHCAESDSAARFTQLLEEHRLLGEHLQGVLKRAGENEIIWRHFLEIERVLFRTYHLDQLVSELLQEMKTRFQLDQVILFLCHPEILELLYPSRTYGSESIGPGTMVFPLTMEKCRVFFAHPMKPVLYSAQEFEAALEGSTDGDAPIRSGVMVPICFRDILYGSLFLCSSDADHYQPEDGTDLLEHLGIKIALCIENCLAYDRVRELAMEDHETGLLSLFQIQAALEKEFRIARRHQTPLSLLLLTLDFYQGVKDDAVLGPQIMRQMAEMLRDFLGEIDARVGRNGSDEFMIVLPLTNEEEARDLAEVIAVRIRRSAFLFENTAILIRPLMSVVGLNEEMRRPRDLLDAAFGELCKLKVSALQQGGM